LRRSNYGFGDAVGLCLVSDVIIPPKFKVHEFEKYKGTLCPKNHLTMYCRRMATHANDEKIGAFLPRQLSKYDFKLVYGSRSRSNPFMEGFS